VKMLVASCLTASHVALANFDRWSASVTDGNPNMSSGQQLGIEVSVLVPTLAHQHGHVRTRVEPGMHMLPLPVSSNPYTGQ
jgi:hypothetical protein